MRKIAEVSVTRKGQTTIPISLRKKYGIRRGARLGVVDTGKGILLKPRVSILDLAGSGSKFGTVAQMKRLLDRLRREDV